MKWNDIVRKLTSRKLWAALAAFVAGVMVYRGSDAGSAEAVGSLIMMGAAAIAYIVGEGLVDAKRAEGETALIEADNTVKEIEE